MKNKTLLLSLLILLVSTLSCGPRRYKCGPYRKCDNFKEKIKNNSIYKEFNKDYYC
ncbi:hypothetical protein IP97_00804 [Flavobacterium cheniae]|uniref:Lipoprotein n=1 Tax=Flavobacterium cheniae TaxID=295428 RepID=A0A562KLQ1_9FLAO|nr:hypothetical protein C8D80_1180 [Flavobacterium cheniae]TWH96267.1 hypothetical protein IP97_00804 [Flavobacterium cheniae]